MKRLILSIVALVSMVSLQAKTQKFEYPDFNVHVYTSDEAMGDVSILVEGEKQLVVVEPQSFYKSIEDFNGYAEALDKPISVVLGNYHVGGLASCSPKKVVVVEPMVEFMKTPMAQGMLKKFDKIFAGAMDTRAVKPRKTVPVSSVQKWAGVEFKLTPGAGNDFPASSVNIGGKVYYTHFSPNKMHPAPMQLSNAKAVDAMLAEMKNAKASGCEVFVGSHGAVASLGDVEFLISYLNKVKQLLAKCTNADSFAQALILSYPNLRGAEKVRAIAKNLYPNDQDSAEKKALRARVQDYLDVVSNLDENLAKSLWAERDDVSIITPRTMFVGFDGIMNDFLKKTFSSMKSRKLQSLSEVINIYDNSANVQLFWVFDTVDAKGQKHQTRGRESLVFAKIKGQWRLTHVHYSRMPE